MVICSRAWFSASSAFLFLAHSGQSGRFRNLRRPSAIVSCTLQIALPETSKVPMQCMSSAIWCTAGTRLSGTSGNAFLYKVRIVSPRISLCFCIVSTVPLGQSLSPPLSRCEYKQSSLSSVQREHDCCPLHCRYPSAHATQRKYIALVASERVGRMVYHHRGSHLSWPLPWTSYSGTDHTLCPPVSEEE